MSRKILSSCSAVIVISTVISVLFIIIFVFGLCLPSMNHYEIRHSYMFEDINNRKCIIFLEITRISRDAGLLRSHSLEYPVRLIKIEISRDFTIRRCTLENIDEMTFSNNITNLFNFKDHFYFMRRDRRSRSCQVFLLDECDIKPMGHGAATQLLQSTKLSCETGTPEETARCDELSLNYGYKRKNLMSIERDYVGEPVKVLDGDLTIIVENQENKKSLILSDNGTFRNRRTVVILTLNMKIFYRYKFQE